MTRYMLLILYPGPIYANTAGPLCARLSGQECPDTICHLLRAQTLLHLLGRLCQSQQHHQEEDGRDAQDLEGASARLHWQQDRIPSRDRQADRERSDRSQECCHSSQPEQLSRATVHASRSSSSSPCSSSQRHANSAKCQISLTTTGTTISSS